MNALCLSAAAVAYMPAMPLVPQPTAARAAVARMMSESDELAMLQAMSDSFWKQKRARMKAELAAQLLELDEFEAREKALQEVAARGAISGAAAPGTGAEDLVKQLEAEKAKTAALEAQLQKQMLAAEVNMQKVSAFWISKLAEAKAALPAADAAPAIAAAAPPAAPAAAPEPEPLAELVDDVKGPYLEEGLSLRELRSRLLGYGLSTTGVKSELRNRLLYAMEHARTQNTQWDPEKAVWN